jgi:hypothetical protein
LKADRDESSDLICDAGTLENPRWTGPRAKEYPFVLDPFQEFSVACIVRLCLPLVFQSTGCTSSETIVTYFIQDPVTTMAQQESNEQVPGSDVPIPVLLELTKLSRPACVDDGLSVQVCQLITYRKLR